MVSEKWLPFGPSGSLACGHEELRSDCLTCRRDVAMQTNPEPDIDYADSAIEGEDDA